MRTRSWLIVTACALLLTAFAVHRAGWLSKDDARPARRDVPRVRATAQDLVASGSGLRYRSGEPRHWKYLMLTKP